MLLLLVVTCSSGGGQWRVASGTCVTHGPKTETNLQFLLAWSKNLREQLLLLPPRKLRMTHENPHHARRWAILALLGVAQLMVVLDATIVNIALPSAQHSLGFSDDSRQWVVTAYALAFGSLLLLGGRIGDLFGRKRVFIAGLLGFALASAIGGAAQSLRMLVASRALQGVFGALLAPAALS